jgi:hypothetical protein
LADYIAGRLEAAGYTVTEHEFVFPFYRVLVPAELEQLSPTPTVYETGTFDFSGSGEVTGQVFATNDIQIPPNPTRRRTPPPAASPGTSSRPPPSRRLPWSSAAPVTSQSR